MDIKIVDFNSIDAANQLVESIKSTGFGVLTNTRVPKTLVNEVYSDYQEFFAREKKDKLKLKFDPKDMSGYFPFKSERAKNSPVGDLKEFYHFFPNKVGSRAIGKATYDLCFALEDLAMEVLHWLDMAYIPTNLAERETQPTPWKGIVENSPATLFRVIHYPPLTGKEEKEAVRAAAHEDINLITLLPAATASGLQVKDKKGNWHPVGTDDNSIIINVGDMLQELTGGYYPSTTHRVVNPDGENTSRFSMPMFLHPKPETRLSKRYTAAEYLDQRLRELGLK